MPIIQYQNPPQTQIGPYDLYPYTLKTLPRSNDFSYPNKDSTL